MSETETTVSRTDHHNPVRVRAHHAHLDGLATGDHHDAHCVNYVDHYGRVGPRPYRYRYVTRTEAEANGWTIAWESGPTAERVNAAVPFGPFACDIDDVHGRCTRWIEDRDRWPYTGPIGKTNRRTYYHAPERAAVRNSLRRALNEARYGGDPYENVDEVVPTGQHRHAMYGGGWWD